MTPVGPRSLDGLGHGIIDGERIRSVDGDPGHLAWVGKVLSTAAQHPADPVQRVVLAAPPMPAGLLLHPAAHVVDAGEPEPHDVEGIQYPHRVGQTGLVDLHRAKLIDIIPIEAGKCWPTG
jgi:hypothetical protein